MTNTDKVLSEFDEKFPYHAVEYGENHEIKRNIFIEIKSFLSSALTAQREEVLDKAIKVVENANTEPYMEPSEVRQLIKSELTNLKTHNGD